MVYVTGRMASSSSSLLGPPEIYLAIPSSSAEKPSSTTTDTQSNGNPLVDLMKENFGPNPPMGYTENLSATYLSTGNPCLDFFFHVVPNTPAETLTERLQLSWAYNPLTTLKLICNLRGVRGTGKTDKEGYYAAALWLHNHHPKTLACNVGPMAEFGYFKDLPEILYRLLEGLDVRRKAKKEFLKRKGGYRGIRDGNGYRVGIGGRRIGLGAKRGGLRSRGRGPIGGRRGRNSHMHRAPSSGTPINWDALFTASNKKKQKAKEAEMRRKTEAQKRAEAEMQAEIERRAEAERQAAIEKAEAERKAQIERVSATMKRAVIEKRAGTVQRKSSKLKETKKIEMAKKAIERYGGDPDYYFLYERISDLFADCLKADLQLLNSRKWKEISLAAKWCPSLDSSFDKSTLLCESIARKVFPKESYPEYEGIEDAHYAYRVRDRLRKQVLVPLRKALKLPEVYIGANQWGEIPYNRVASVAMNFYRDKFLKHDKQRFEDYLEKVKSGKATIAAGALLPHEIIGSLYKYGGYVAELQWKRMVDDMSKKGKLKNCLAVCDVSGSMIGTPMEVSVALGVLISELSEEPWSGRLITFSAHPKLQKVEGNDLRSKINFVKSMQWGMNTDFQKVFDLILEVAVNGNLKEDQMIKRIFVFSDMEFDLVSKRDWETDYQAITRKFTDRGYGSCVPEVVFWNLRDSRATPVPRNQPGVALVSGFSKNLMTIFLKENGAMNPEIVMEAAIAGEEYKKLVVLD